MTNFSNLRQPQAVEYRRIRRVDVDDVCVARTAARHIEPSVRRRRQADRKRVRLRLQNPAQMRRRPGQRQRAAGNAHREVRRIGRIARRRHDAQHAIRKTPRESRSR